MGSLLDLLITPLGLNSVAAPARLGWSTLYSPCARGTPKNPPTNSAPVGRAMRANAKAPSRKTQARHRSHRGELAVSGVYAQLLTPPAPAFAVRRRGFIDLPEFRSGFSLFRRAADYNSGRAALAARMNPRTFTASFLPGADSTPVETSTPYGRTRRTASATFSGVNPPARKMGRPRV